MNAADSANARVYINGIMEASFKAGNKNHPKGSALVKELFSASNALRGWAVMVKTDANSNQGKGWYWYEVLSTTSGASPVADGNGVGLCTGCHSSGNDYIRTSYPLQ